MLQRIVACLVVVLFGGAFAHAGEVSTIGLVLENRDRYGQEVLNAATKAFLDSKRFSVFERTRLDQVVKEQELQQFTGKDVQLLAKLTGIDYLGLVSYTVSHHENGYKIRMSVRVIDASTGFVAATVDDRSKGIDVLGMVGAGEAGEKLRENISLAFPVTGYIVKNEGEVVVVDLGKGDGLKKGDLLEVVEEGEPFKHPVTGELLPGEERVRGTLKVRTVSDQVSVCKVLKRTEASIGDRVRFRQRKFELGF